MKRQKGRYIFLTIVGLIALITLVSCKNLQSSSASSLAEQDERYAIYLLALQSGSFEGTYEEWFASIKGDAGVQGDKGEVGPQGPTGGKGETGANGKSAYEIYLGSNPNYLGTEEEWLDDLINGRLGNREAHVVTFNSAGGTLVEDQTVIHGEKISKPEVYREGYSLDGWYIDGEKWQFHGYVVTYNMELTALWIEKKTNQFVLDGTNGYSNDEYIYVNKDGETNFQYSKAYLVQSSHVGLRKNGLITNTTAISGIKTIKVTFLPVDEDAHLFVYSNNNPLPIANETEIFSGEAVTLNGNQYFVIEAQNGAVIINEIIIEYEYNDVITLKKIPKIFVETTIDSKGNHIIPKDKINYIDSEIYISDAEDSTNNLGTEKKPLVAGIRLRGNSTMGTPKKPYRIKFDKKQSVFGLPSNKSWVLLADYMDASSLHNFSALKFAAELEGFDFSSSANYVELILNGVSQGLYLLTDHIEANKNRVNIEMDIKEQTMLEDINFLFELDASALTDSTEILDVTYFKYKYSETRDLYYTLKYPKLEDFPSEEKYFAFFDHVKEYVDGMWKLFQGTNTAALNNKINLDSLIDFMMTDFIFQERDHSKKSFKMYHNASEDKLYFGPVWDYDSCSFSIPHTGAPVDDIKTKIFENSFASTDHFNLYFQLFAQNHNGEQLLRDRYIEKGSKNLAKITMLVSEQYPHIAATMIYDTNMWYSGNLSMVFQNVKYLIEYLSERQKFLDQRYGV